MRYRLFISKIKLLIFRTINLITIFSMALIVKRTYVPAVKSTRNIRKFGYSQFKINR